MDLYSLPKDILVKLVATIREDVVKEYEEYKVKCLEYERILKEISVVKCSKENCKAYAINNRIQLPYNTDKIIYCNGKTFCREHYDEYIKNLYL